MTESLSVDAGERDLLDVEQMMKFTCDGFVRLDDVVPAELNRLVLSELDAYEGSGYKYWHISTTIRTVFELPRLRGALRSLMGPDPLYNHSFVHIVPARHPQAQDWHADAVIDTRPFRFDVLVMYFPQDTAREMGPPSSCRGRTCATSVTGRSLTTGTSSARSTWHARAALFSSSTPTFGIARSQTRRTVSATCSKCGCSSPLDGNSGGGLIPKVTGVRTSSRRFSRLSSPGMGPSTGRSRSSGPSSGAISAVMTPSTRPTGC